VGASLLAKNVNDNACLLNQRGACEFFASKLAPTGIRASSLATGSAAHQSGVDTYARAWER
ncbi:hypothetical protein, partial [Pseudomonas paralactis]|uniref:hypothetical protein n=1 Tax=Pseudomonas paralactis TaxID=1615673 RepID=UPI0034D4443F